MFDGVERLQAETTRRRLVAVLTRVQLVDVVVGERLATLETAPLPLGADCRRQLLAAVLNRSTRLACHLNVVLAYAVSGPVFPQQINLPLI